MTSAGTIRVSERRPYMPRRVPQLLQGYGERDFVER